MNGWAGSAICRALQRAGYSNLLTASRAELDLENGPDVQRWFAEHTPTVVVLAAAKVGGIQANNSYPADFLLENLKIQTNVIETAWRSAVRRLLFLGSSCIYPKIAEQPIREDALLTGPLEPTNSHVLPALIRRFHEAAEAKAPSVACWGTGVDLSIRELAGAVARATGYSGTIQWDTSKPDGTPKKQLAEGLRSTVAQFREQLSQRLVRL